MTGELPIISIPYLWSGFYTARDPLVAPAPPGLVGSAGFYSADLILTGFKRRQRKLHGLSRERDAVLRRGGGLCWTRSLQGERSYISMGHHVQWYQLVVPRYPYGILVVVAYSGFARGAKNIPLVPEIHILSLIPIHTSTQ